jgi:glycosyl transferase family 1
VRKETTHGDESKKEQQAHGGREEVGQHRLEEGGRVEEGQRDVQEIARASSDGRSQSREEAGEKIERLKRLLFIRNFRRPTGGNVSFRDYFFHALADPRLDTRIYFAPGSRHRESDLWSELPAERVVAAPDWDACDFVFVNGKDWRLMPPGSLSFRVLHLVQHLGYSNDPELRDYLARPAIRICLSAAVQESIVPYANGPISVIPSGIDSALFHDDGTRRAGSVLIWGGKSPELAEAIRDRLASHGVSADVLTGWLSRRDFAARLRATDLFVGLSQPEEGFYRPALEAMACGCAVVCSDARGNRAHCIAGVTCLQPPHGDADGHAAAVLQLLADPELAERLRDNARALSREFSIGIERARLHAVFDELLAE